MSNFFDGEGRLDPHAPDTSITRAAETTGRDPRPEVGTEVRLTDEADLPAELAGRECVIVDLDPAEERPYLLEVVGPEPGTGVPFRFWTKANQFEATQ